MNSKLVSIAVITRNRQNYVQKCLIALQKQNKNLIKEIVIIDNASSDNTKSVVADFTKTLPIKYIYESCIGIPYARNRALQEATGELLAFIDDDGQAAPSWIDEMVKAHKKYPDAIAIQGRAIFAPEKNFFAKSFALGYDFWIWRSRIGKSRITICDTANLLIQRKKIRALRVTFDIQFSRGSDVDFAKQLLEKKQNIVYAQKAAVFVSVRSHIIALFYQRYLIGKASKQLENKWGIPKKLLEEQTREYKKRLRVFLASCSFGERQFFSLYKPLYTLGRMRVPTIIHEHVISLPIKRLKRRSTITVAIITRNRKQALRRCLASITRQTVMPFEVLIIDNASSDGTYEYIVSENFPFTLRYIYEKKVGVVHARNRALQEVENSLLAFIDDDCEASPTWVEAMMKSHTKYPQTAIIQGKCIVYPKKGVISAVMQYLYDYGIQKYLYGTSLFTLDTANVLLHVSMLKRQNMFFKSSQYYGEDIDVCYQAWYQNQQVIYDPSIVSYSWRRFSKIALARRQYDKGVGRAAIDKKWRVFLHKNFFVINGTKHALAASSLEEHKKNFLQVKFVSKSFVYWIKAQMLLVIYKWLFKIGYIHGKMMHQPIATSSSSAIQTTPLTVGIITRDRAQKLKNLLTSLEKQTKYPQEILVVDNASSDMTKDVVLSFTGILSIRYVREEKVGIAYARNRVMQEAKTKLLAFIDDDCEASPTWIEDMVQAHNKNPDALAIQGRCIYTPERSIKATVVDIHYSYWVKVHTDQRNRLSILDTKNVLFRLDKIKKHSITFDTRYKIGDDVDFGKQILYKNEEIIYKKNMVVYHSEKKSIYAFLKNYYLKGKDRAFTEYKWPEQQKNSIRLHAEKEEKITNICESFSFIKKLVFLFLLHTSIKVFQAGYERNRYKKQLLRVIQPNKKKVNFSVCIVTKDRSHNLYRCLFSLVKQSFVPSEIIVVDSSTNPRKTRLVLAQFKNVLPIRYIFENAQGIGHARNTAMQHVEGKIFAFIDDDCEAGQTWIEEMVRAHREYPDVAAIQGKVFFVPFTGVLSKVNQDEYYSWVTYNLQKNHEFLSLDFENTSFKYTMIHSAKAACDIRYKTFYYCDDVDFGYQLLYASQKIIFYPKAYVFAKRKRHLYALLVQRWLKGRSRAVLDVKWQFFGTHTVFYLLKKRFPLWKSKGVITDNPFLIDNRHHVSQTGMNFFYPFIAWLFGVVYQIGYRFQRFSFEHNYKRLSHSVLPKTDETNQVLQVSVMVITKDRNTLQRSLDSLIKQRIKPKEVVIIDSSKVRVEEILQKYKKILPIIYMYQSPAGFGVARNTAMLKASGDIVATLDDDAQADAFWIENIIKAHAAFPTAIAIQGRIVSMPHTAPIAIVEQLHIERWFLRQLDDTNTFHSISTKNISFKREYFLSQKLRFTENKLYGMYGSEDIDMSFQIAKRRLVLLYEPSIVVKHWERASIKEYLQQQYRKGMGSMLISRDWGSMVKKRKPYISLPNVLETIILILSNSLSQKKLYLYPYFLVLFFLARKQYMNGKKDMKQRLQGIKRKPTVPVSVVILYNCNLQALTYLLSQLAYQTCHPQKVIIVSSKNRELKNTLKTMEVNLSIVSVSFGQFAEKTGRLLQGSIVTCIDEYTIPSSVWLESVFKAHQAYPEAIIQGMTRLSKMNDPFSCVVQFIKQTLIRNSLGKHKSIYWKWIRGEVQKKISTHIYDRYTLSLKLHTSFDAELFLRSLLKEEISMKDKVLLVPTIQLTRVNTMNISSFLQQAGDLGKTELVGDYYKEIFITSFSKRLAAFTYFCLRNNKIVFLPVLLLYYVLFQVVFLYAQKKQKSDPVLHSKKWVSAS